MERLTQLVREDVPDALPGGASLVLIEPLSFATLVEQFDQQGIERDRVEDDRSSARTRELCRQRR